MRPDILFIEGMPASMAAKFSRLTPAEKRQLRGRCKVHLIEVGYTSNTRYHEKRAEKLQQHTQLINQLSEEGWNVEYHTCVLGTGAFIFIDTVDMLDKLKVPHATSQTTLQALHRHAAEKVRDIILCSRKLEHQGADDGPRHPRCFGRRHVGCRCRTAPALPILKEVASMISSSMRWMFGARPFQATAPSSGPPPAAGHAVAPSEGTGDAPSEGTGDASLDCLKTSSAPTLPTIKAHHNRRKALFDCTPPWEQLPGLVVRKRQQRPAAAAPATLFQPSSRGAVRPRHARQARVEAAEVDEELEGASEDEEEEGEEVEEADGEGEEEAQAEEHEEAELEAAVLAESDSEAAAFPLEDVPLRHVARCDCCDASSDSGGACTGDGGDDVSQDGSDADAHAGDSCNSDGLGASDNSNDEGVDNEPECSGEALEGCWDEELLVRSTAMAKAQRAQARLHTAIAAERGALAAADQRGRAEARQDRRLRAAYFVAAAAEDAASSALLAHARRSQAACAARAAHLKRVREVVLERKSKLRKCMGKL